MPVDVQNLTVVKIPADILRQTTQPVNISDEIKAVSLKMIELMKANNGIGLAAPQVGLPWSLFVMYIPDEMIEPKVILNPDIIRTIGRDYAEEGCLSIPDVRRTISRWKTIRVEYTNLSGTKVSETLKGLEARCFQHEKDHLLGKLITDY